MALWLKQKIPFCPIMAKDMIQLYNHQVKTRPDDRLKLMEESCWASYEKLQQRIDQLENLQADL